jgi:hypothetical protein
MWQSGFSAEGAPVMSSKREKLPEELTRFESSGAHRMHADSDKATARGKSTPAGNRAVAKRSKLAKWGDPYVMADGKIIQPEVMFEDQAKVNVKSSSEYRPQRKRSIPDLPASPKVMKGIGLVFTFTILGVPDREIAEILGITPSEVRQVRAHPGYGETFEIVASEFVSAKSKRLVSRIAAYADGALDNVYNIAMHGTKENNVLKASIDLLDRAGVRPKDLAGDKGQQNELRITIVKSDDAEVVVNGMTLDN